MIDRIADGRTDLVFDYLAQEHPANSKDKQGVSLIQWCAYYGDVGAIRFLLANGESLESLGENFDLNGAAFHEHWRLCQFLIEHIRYRRPEKRRFMRLSPNPIIRLLSWQCSATAVSLNPEAIKRSIAERAPG